MCEQTYEFGNYGCAEVEGRVIGSHGQPLRGVNVGPQYVTDDPSGVYSSGYVDTDAEGRFRFRIRRMVARPVAVTPDTFTVYVRALVYPPPVVGATSPARDSVLVKLELMPVGTKPKTASVEIQLDYPK